MEARHFRIKDYSMFAVPYLDILNYDLNEKLLNQHEESLMIKYQYVPIEEYANTTTVAMVDPTLNKIKELEAHTGRKIQVFYIFEEQFNSVKVR